MLISSSLWFLCFSVFSVGNISRMGHSSSTTVNRRLAFAVATLAAPGQWTIEAGATRVLWLFAFCWPNQSPARQQQARKNRF